MQGHILDLNGTDGRGVVVSFDGSRYTFGLPDWRGQGLPQPGVQVDFVATEGAARDLFPLPGAPGSAHVYAAAPRQHNSVVLGWAGVACLLLGFIVPILPWIVSFVTGLMAADAAKRTGNGTGLVLGRLAWIGAVVLFLAGVALIVVGISFLAPILAEAMRQMPMSATK